MDPDLQDFLMAWTGGALSEARYAELLTRIASDEAFREQVIAEIRLLGMLKAVQSPEPRWLVLADALTHSGSGVPPFVGADQPESGESSDQRKRTEHPFAAAESEDAFADAVMRKIVMPPSSLFRRLALPVSLVATVAMMAGAGLWWSQKNHSPKPGPASQASPALAVISEIHGGLELSGRSLQAGETLSLGRLKMKSGTATLSFYNGATMYLEGETDMDILSMDHVACRLGRLHVRAEGNAAGFTVTAPGVAVVDLGTEFAVNVGSDGRSAMHVFEGQVEASLLSREGYTVRSELLDKDQSATASPGNGKLLRDTLPANDFAAAHPIPVQPLKLDPAYPGEIVSSHPWGYWRFETMENGVIPNEIGGLPLRISGPLMLSDEANGNHALHFPSAATDEYALMDGIWQSQPGGDYAVEAWVMPESVRLSALVSLIADESLDLPEKHYFLLQLMDRSQRWLHPNGSIRFLHRSPPGGGGGVNAFADHPYVPGRWHHLVAQKNGTRLELYLNGRLAGEAVADPDDTAGAFRLLLGRLKQSQKVKLTDARPFVGRLDELALYEHPLTPAEIARHYALGSSQTSP